jgi:hypothetical protein
MKKDIDFRRLVGSSFGGLVDLRLLTVYRLKLGRLVDSNSRLFRGL